MPISKYLHALKRELDWRFDFYIRILFISNRNAFNDYSAYMKDKWGDKYPL